MTDTQVMAAPEPTQVDREALDKIMRVFGNSLLVHREQVDKAIQIITRHRIASSRTGSDQ